jgi:ribonuclease P protein component
MKQYSFKKEERLCSKKHIDALFAQGSSFVLYPFRIVFLEVSPTLPVPVQVLMSVSKRRFPKAVDRNRIKRQMRECYRLSKPALLRNLATSSNAEQWIIAIQYVSKEPTPYVFMQKRMQELIARFWDESTKLSLGNS